MGLRQGVYLAPFGELADPRVTAALAAEAEAAGFDGVFLWDHLVRPRDRGLAVGETWTALAAMATATAWVRLGTRVTPVSRRRPAELARQAVALDQLSGGRCVLGVGLGGDTGGEFTRLGEATDLRERARLLDEGLAVITALWTGEPVEHRGPRFVVDDLVFTPRPVQRPRIPVWVAAQSVRDAPLRRAARYDGLCPEGSPDDVARMLDIVAGHRGDLTGYDVVVAGTDPGDAAAYARAGATWWPTQVPEHTTAAAAAALVRRGPVAV
ncbi:LLM class flavin-dependent oxidoreductase [Nocardia thailandica]|uniref:LLM class flavin-dependent oxidoreductase n=1 Tax=Nocardia thailandica TaxID=257275 RepID=A0ABW6PM01_9NOCA